VVVVVGAGAVVVVVAGLVVVVVVLLGPCEDVELPPWLAAPVRSVRLIPATTAAVTRFRGMTSPSEPSPHRLRTGTIRRSARSSFNRG
jgi:hypothetical protein